MGQATGADHWPTSDVVGAATVTATEVLVIVLPAGSRATACRTWLPGVTFVVSQTAAYGIDVTSAPRGAPSTKNWTPTTPTLSDAIAQTETRLKTVDPAAGAAMA